LHPKIKTNQYMFLKLFLITIALLGIAFIGFATQILLKKGGLFPQTEINDNPAMQKLGITCVKCDDAKSCAKPISQEEIPC